MKSTRLYFFHLSNYLVVSLLLQACLTLFSCNIKDTSLKSDRIEQTVIDTLPADFVAFFNQFHEDSAFQMAHIIFPLEGLPNSTGDGDTTSTSRYFWQRADWKIQHPFTDPGHNFEHWYEVSNERIIEHWIQMKGTNLYMWRRFAKLEDGWYLIYYQGMRPMAKSMEQGAGGKE